MNKENGLHKLLFSSLYIERERAEHKENGKLRNSKVAEKHFEYKADTRRFQLNPKITSANFE